RSQASAGLNSARFGISIEAEISVMGAGIGFFESIAHPSLSATLPFLPSAADLNANRCPEEAKCLPQLVDQETLIREMERRGDVGEEHERRRRHADLRRVEDAHVLAAGADRRVGCGDG